MKSIIIAMMVVAMMTVGIGTVAAGSTDVTFAGDGSYDLKYGGSGNGLLFAHTFTSDGFDHLSVDFGGAVSGQQSLDTSSGWTHIDRDSKVDGGYGVISTASGTDGTHGAVSTSVSSDDHMKIIDQDVDITGATGVNVETYHAAATDGSAGAQAYGGSTIGANYTTVVNLGASDHSVLHTNASAGYGDSRVEFDTNDDGRGLKYGGTTGDGQLVVYTNTEYNFGQELQGTYDATTISVDANNGYDGQFTMVVDFDTTCDVDGYGATSYYYPVNN